MKKVLGILILFGFYSTVAVAQREKSHTAGPPKGHHARNVAGNAEGEFTKRETSTVHRYEKHAGRERRKAEKARRADNDRRRVDARRAEKSFAKKNS